MERHEHDRDQAPLSSPPSGGPSFFGELVRFALLAFIIVLPIRVFIAQPFIVAGASMEPTFESGEYLIVDQLTYRIEEPERGDVVIFRYPRNPSKFFIKRIIGLPGETVQVSGTDVLVANAEHPEGFRLEEPYLGAVEKEAFLTTTLGDGEYFVLGDNRDKSSDSRTWGVLSRDEIIGRAFLRLLPITGLSLFPGEAAPGEATR